MYNYLSLVEVVLILNDNLSLVIVSMNLTVDCIFYLIHVSIAQAVRLCTVAQLFHAQINFIALEPVDRSLQDLAIADNCLSSLRKRDNVIVLMT
jgi:hypothetical protein